MRLSREGHSRNSGITVFFDKSPAVSFNKTSKEVRLSVKGIRGVQGDKSKYNFSISLTVAELQTIIGSLADATK